MLYYIYIYLYEKFIWEKTKKRDYIHKIIICTNGCEGSLSNKVMHIS